MSHKFKYIAILFGALIFINFLASNFYQRFDLTDDKRYSIAPATKKIIQNVKEATIIKVYLTGDFPADFKRLEIETRWLLEELKSYNKNIFFKFIDPTDIREKLLKKGIKPTTLQIQQAGKREELIIFPWATISYKNKSIPVSLLKDIYTYSQNEQLESSIQNLEYAFADALHQITNQKSKKIAILKGNGQLDDIYIADFLKKLGQYYLLAPFTLDSVQKNPTGTLKKLQDFDLLISAKPSIKFNEQEKFVLDQYAMQGGKSLWLVDQVQVAHDSLRKNGSSIAYPVDLGLTDFFFNYGVRINSNLVSDKFASQITLSTGNIGNTPQFDRFNWELYPLTISKNNHEINRHLEMVRFQYANSIDTLKNKVKKTVLLQSSSESKLVATPYEIDLNTILNNKESSSYSKKEVPLAVLLEGSFKSAFAGRVKPFDIEKIEEVSIPTKMIVISDGDLIANEVSRGKPLALGLDKWSNQQFGNKEFLLNCVNYLVDDTGLINLRLKNITIDFLDKKKAYEETTKWQFINVLLPLLLLFCFSIAFRFYRKSRV